MKPTVVFWYEFASTYSYLTVMRIDDEASRAGVEIEWRPFLLGPIFMSQGWTTSPFNVYPAKGRYMVRDIGRIAAERGLPFTMPETFPINGLKAARLAIAADKASGRRRLQSRGIQRSVHERLGRLRRRRADNMLNVMWARRRRDVGAEQRRRRESSAAPEYRAGSGQRPLRRAEFYNRRRRTFLGRRSAGPSAPLGDQRKRNRLLSPRLDGRSRSEPGIEQNCANEPTQYWGS